MPTIDVKVKKNYKNASIAKQLPFALARALTKTAKDAQGEILKVLPDDFTLRGNWFKPSNKFGIRVKTAKKTDLVAEVGTDAEWLKESETGGTRKPRSSRSLALPVIGSVARKNLTAKIPRGSTPRKLIQAGNAFIMTTRTGKTGVYVFRKGLSREAKNTILLNIEQRNKSGAGKPVKYSRNNIAPFSLVYGLQGYRTFKKNSAIIEPTIAIVAKNLNDNFLNAMADAMKTAK